jgi:hypothetical protein
VDTFLALPRREVVILGEPGGILLASLIMHRCSYFLGPRLIVQWQALRPVRGHRSAEAPAHEGGCRGDLPWKEEV